MQPAVAFVSMVHETRTRMWREDFVWDFKWEKVSCTVCSLYYYKCAQAIAWSSFDDLAGVMTSHGAGRRLIIILEIIILCLTNDDAPLIQCRTLNGCNLKASGFTTWIYKYRNCVCISRFAASHILISFRIHHFRRARRTEAYLPSFYQFSSQFLLFAPPPSPVNALRFLVLGPNAASQFTNVCHLSEECGRHSENEEHIEWVIRW